MRPPSSHWIPTKLTSSPTSSYSTPASVSATLQLFLGSLSISKYVSSLKAKFFSRLKAFRCISASLWGSSKESFSVLYKAFFRPLLTYASPEWFLYHQIGTPSPSGKSRHLWLPFVLRYYTSSLRGVSISPASHPDSFCSVIL